MKNLLALIGLVVVGFAIIGWYCEWYKLTVNTGTEGKPEFKTTVDTNKVVDDSSSFFKRLEQMAIEKARTAGEKSPPPNTPPGTSPGPIAPVKGEAPSGGSTVPTKTR